MLLSTDCRLELDPVCTLKKKYESLSLIRYTPLVGVNQSSSAQSLRQTYMLSDSVDYVSVSQIIFTPWFFPIISQTLEQRKLGSRDNKNSL